METYRSNLLTIQRIPDNKWLKEIQIPIPKNANMARLLIIMALTGDRASHAGSALCTAAMDISRPVAPGMLGY